MGLFPPSGRWKGRQAQMTPEHRSGLTPVHRGARLAPRASAPRFARKLVRDICTESGLPDSVADAAALVAGGLVTISVHQVRSPLDVVVLIAADEVTVQVSDVGTVSPDGTGTGTASTPRRCWAMVGRLGRSSGYRPTALGREMWASFARHAVPAVPAVPAAPAAARHRTVARRGPLARTP